MLSCAAQRRLTPAEAPVSASRRYHAAIAPRWATAAAAPWAAVSPRLRDYQAVAEVEGGTMKELVVSAVPLAGSEIALQHGKAVLHIAHLGEGRDGGSDVGTQVRLGAPPVRAEEAV